MATAGHVDHGKSTLVRAITGMEPDRLVEERARGLTIDLGFVWTDLPSGRQVAFVDVPGHIRFIENALAGVGMVDACVFVVAATEGWKPQSEEHLRILELLGVTAGIVVVTKAAAVDVATLQARIDEVRSHLAGSFLDGVPVLAVDVVAGSVHPPVAAGVEGSQPRIGRGNPAAVVTAAVDDLLATTPPARDDDRPRLWVDRSFTVAGAGTVVTGTLTGGALSVGDELAVVPPRGATAVRVRGMQTHHTPVTSATPGRRLAVNLAGIPRRSVARGQALVRPGQWEPARVVDATLHVLASLDHPVQRRGAYRLHTGSAALQVALRIIGASGIEPGTQGAVRLHLPTPLALTPGDRFVLRETGRAETVGGGEVLDVAPVLPASRARPDRSVDRVVRERSWVEPDLLYRLTGVRRKPDVGAWVVDPDARHSASQALRGELHAAGPAGLDLAGADDRTRALLATMPGVQTSRGRAHLQDEPVAPSLAEHPFLRALDAVPFSPPDPRESGVDAATLRELVDEGLLVRCGDCWFSRAAIDRAAAEIARLLRRTPGGVTVSDVRSALGTSRRFALPLLAHLDLTGVTRRRGDVRVGGPRLPGTSAGGGTPTPGAGTTAADRPDPPVPDQAPNQGSRRPAEPQGGTDALHETGRPCDRGC